MHIFSKRILIIGFFIAIIWVYIMSMIRPSMFLPDDVFITVDPCGPCLCCPDGECCDESLSGWEKPSENVKGRIKPSFFLGILDAVGNYWSEMISKWWFEPVFSYLMLVLVVFVFEIIRKVRKQQSLE